jgi:GTP cyclohydrolase I
MRDIQKEPDGNGIDIDKVGIKNLKYPISVLDRKNKKQGTIATISACVDLPRHFKGTHMSRFVEILNESRCEITIKNMPEILKNIADKLEGNSSHLDIQFTYFIEKEAPKSKQKSLMDYKCRFIGSYQKPDRCDFILEVIVPILTLCPCSKEISKYNAHNQRSEVTVKVRFKKFVWIEYLVEIVESVASSGLYTLLKRPDEKYVTEHSYDNPRFVEDIVRRVSKELIENNNITWFSVESENFESIHNHNAYAFVERTKKSK